MTINGYHLKLLPPGDRKRIAIDVDSRTIQTTADVTVGEVLAAAERYEPETPREDDTPDLFTMEIAGQAWRYRLIDGWPILAGRREDVVLDFAERVVLVSNRTDNATLAALIGDAVLRIIEGVITADNAPAVTRTAAVADWSWIDGEDEEDDDDDEDAGEEWKGGGK